MAGTQVSYKVCHLVHKVCLTISRVANSGFIVDHDRKGLMRHGHSLMDVTSWPIFHQGYIFDSCWVSASQLEKALQMMALSCRQCPQSSSGLSHSISSGCSIIPWHANLAGDTEFYGAVPGGGSYTIDTFEVTICCWILRERRDQTNTNKAWT